MTFKGPVLFLRSGNISGPAGMPSNYAPSPFQILGQAPVQATCYRKQNSEKEETAIVGFMSSFPLRNFMGPLYSPLNLYVVETSSLEIYYGFIFPFFLF